MLFFDRFLRHKESVRGTYTSQVSLSSHVQIHQVAQSGELGRETAHVAVDEVSTRHAREMHELQPFPSNTKHLQGRDAAGEEIRGHRVQVQVSQRSVVKRL